MAYSGGNGGLLNISLLGREIAKLVHDTKLIPSQHVTPFVRGNKNDCNDAIAITEACQRDQNRFVPVKSGYQQKNLVYIVSENELSKQTATSNNNAFKFFPLQVSLLNTFLSPILYR